MDITIGHIHKFKKDSSKNNPNLYINGSSPRADRRKNKQDRRRSVREGVFVSFTGRDDNQRMLRDRRKSIF